MLARVHKAKLWGRMLITTIVNENFGDIGPHPRQFVIKKNLIVRIMLVSAVIATVRRSRERTIERKRLRAEEAGK